MKIAVTGGAGFIGSHTTKMLTDKGHDVIVIDDLSTGHREAIPAGAGFYEIDIQDKKLDEVFRREKPETVYHFAAQVKVVKSIQDPWYDLDVNLGGTLNLLEACRKNNIHKVIYSSTGGAVYGEPELNDLPVSEEYLPNPLSFYGIHKHTVEHYLHMYYKNYGLNFTTLRYPNVYGPGQDPHGEAGVVAIFSIILLDGRRPTIFGDGSKTRDYLFVGDVVNANLAVMDSADGETFNLGWGKGIRDDEVFHAVKTATGTDIEPIYAEKRTGEVDHICLDASKIKNMLGWKPEVEFSEGIKRSVEYYRSRPPWIKSF